MRLPAKELPNATLLMARGKFIFLNQVSTP